MYCSNCQTDVEVKNGYCSRCGTAMSARLCPNGHVMDPSWSECRYCTPSAKSGGVKGQTLVEAEGGESPAPGGFVKGATLLEEPVSGHGTKGRTLVEGSGGQVEGASLKGQTVVDTGGPGTGGSKKRTVFDPGLADGKTAAPQQLPKLVGWLVTFSLDPSGTDFRLREGRNVIGADPDECDLVIKNDDSVSGQHAVVMFREGQFQIRDNDSTNGTYVNGRDIFGEGAVMIQNLDRIRLGNVELVLYAI